MNIPMFILFSLSTITVTVGIFLYGYGLGVKHTKIRHIRKIIKETPSEDLFFALDDID